MSATPKLLLWGRTSSINVRKVMLCVQLLGIDCERRDAGAAFGVVKTPEYLAHNPNALVPMLDDDGFTLWESNVIVRYLAAKHAKNAPSGLDLYADDLRARFDAERWMDWQQTVLNHAGRDAFVQLVRVAPEARDTGAVERSIAATEPLLAMLDTHLATRRFMAGETIGMADIPIACEMHRWWGLPLAHAAHPHLARWYDSIKTLPAARGVLDLVLS